MIGIQFYPTPAELIEKMVARYVVVSHSGRYRSIKHNRILEPSAGKGDIADWVANNAGVVDEWRPKDKSRIDCIEIDPDLQDTLRGKGYRVIDSDFLVYNEAPRYDLILMNPPWADGAKHLMKAWDILLDGGDIACVLNAETVRNTCHKERQWLEEIIKQHGETEIVPGAFKNAERRTNVDAVIVWLHKPERASDINFDGTQFETEGAVNDEEYNPNFLANRNLIGAIVAQYDNARRLIIEQHELQKRYRFYTKSVSTDDKKDPTWDLYSRLDELKAAFWNYIFAQTKIGRAVTSDYQKKFDQKRMEMRSMAFSEPNIIAVLEGFFFNRHSIIQECLLKIFDDITALHADNKVGEGWKTNKSWKINSKIIVPWGVRYQIDRSQGRTYTSWGQQHYKQEFYSDLDKVLCFLAGFSIEQIGTINRAIQMHLDAMDKGRDYRLQFESSFFTIRIFKKGTVHLVFKDKELWDRFNIAAAEGKNWIGNGQ